MRRKSKGQGGSAARFSPRLTGSQSRHHDVVRLCFLILHHPSRVTVCLEEAGCLAHLPKLSSENANLFLEGKRRFSQLRGQFSAPTCGLNPSGHEAIESTVDPGNCAEKTEENTKDTCLRLDIWANHRSQLLHCVGAGL